LYFYRHLDQVSYEEGVIEHNRSEARIGKTKEIAKNAKKVLGLSVEQIQQLTGLTKEEIEKI